ncbi:DNA replication licensing factor MCM2 [Zea mays]|uniref:DNA replication licensing factor MCM2 n=1 Tax=Zea mays TaxID=4577 RepID=A0A317YBK6_MAIZE|nr:DNA replication licensing factor MCM2 [Zea mays]
MGFDCAHRSALDAMGFDYVHRSAVDIVIVDVLLRYITHLDCDYRRMDEHDQYESIGLDDSLEDERNLDETMADRRVVEVEPNARDVRTGVADDKKS